MMTASTRAGSAWELLLRARHAVAIQATTEHTLARRQHNVAV